MSSHQSDCSSSPDADAAVGEVQKESYEKQKLARRENRAVRKLRIIVFFVLFLTAVAVTSFVYIYTRNDQEDDFETVFEASGQKMIESFHVAVERKLGAIDALAVSITAHALSTGSVFPNVTLPHYEVRAASARILADSFNMGLCLYVTDETRLGWEAYVQDNLDWLDEGLDLENKLRAQQDVKFGYPPTIATGANYPVEVFDATAQKQVFGLQGPKPPNSGPYFPYWHLSPVLPTKTYNLDKKGMKSIKLATASMLDSHQAHMGMMSDMDNSDKGLKGSLPNFYLQLSQYRHVFGSLLGEPATTMIYPVFTDFGPDKKIAGFISTLLFYKQYFTGVLPTDVQGIICVVENNFNQTISYRIDGKDATFLGWEDFHESKYDDMEISTNVVEYLKKRASPETQSYTVVDLNDEFGQHKLRVYPSTTMEDDYVTNEPIIFAVVVAAVFLFTSLVFVAYDCMVERRQTIVMNRAVASGAIVSSLFPEQVRDRLYEADSKEKPDAWFKSDKETSLQGMADQISQERSEDAGQSSKPIADKFSNTTVFFADLAGFTKWSSSREPEQVFELFETLYGAMDRIALKRRVFKVETIGDCYMAVTGLPQPQEDHAVRMARFASESMDKMVEVTNALRDTLGEDTAELQMRAGLHSGPVTAGVLRGQRARFQLFGDTVNTASRMESNGIRGRIHVSQSTADELTARGKGHWLTPREDTVVAKGKGEMKTYFVNIKAEKSITSSVMSPATTTEDEGEEWDRVLSDKLSGYLSKH